MKSSDLKIMEQKVKDLSKRIEVLEKKISVLEEKEAMINKNNFDDLDNRNDMSQETIMFEIFGNMRNKPQNNLKKNYHIV